MEGWVRRARREAVTARQARRRVRVFHYCWLVGSEGGGDFPAFVVQDKRGAITTSQCFGLELLRGVLRAGKCC